MSQAEKMPDLSSGWSLRFYGDALLELVAISEHVPDGCMVVRFPTEDIHGYKRMKIAVCPLVPYRKHLRLLDGGLGKDRKRP